MGEARSETDFDESNDDSQETNSSISLEENDQHNRPTETNFDPVIYAKKPWEHKRLMENQKLREIAGLLVDTDNPTKVSAANFCVEDTLSPNDIRISVKEIGKLKFPLAADTINKLKNISTKAKYGVGEKTVLNENFRDTHMISSADLNVEINENSLTTLLQRMQVSLGIAEDKKLNASLHNLLIYEEGQFFERHRDSEKVPNMVATLVIVLPSPHIGGDLIVEHGKKKYKISSENLDEITAKCICFYSDCWHSVKKVKKGNRIVLTYNVALEGDNVDFKPVNLVLKEAVQQYFDEGDAKKLVFLLNHCYSENSLRWNLLKGEDSKIALSFLAVAKSLDLTVHLALVKIYQHWICGDNEYHIEADMELFETKHKLKFWVGADNTVRTYEPFRPDNSEICFTKETFYRHFKPQTVEADGPSGNEGCTSSFWYQRAAVVLWEDKYSEKIMLELNSAQITQRLSELIKSPGNEEEVQYIVNLAGIDLFPNLITSSDPFEDAVNIALYVKDEDTALIALDGYTGSTLNKKNIPLILAIQKEYGVKFLTQILQEWLDLGQIHMLMPFVADYLKAGGAMEAMQFVTKHKVKSLTETTGFFHCYSDERNLDAFKACDVVGDLNSQELYAEFLTSQEFKTKSELVDLYLILKGLNPKGYTAVLYFLIESINADIRNMESEGFWYIGAKCYSKCDCDECKPVYDFLKSNNQSLALKGNSILHLQSKFHNKPVTISKQGRGKNAAITIKKYQSVYQNNEKKFKELSELLPKLGPTASKREFVGKRDTVASKKKK